MAPARMITDISQTTVFLQGEGDRWFERNRNALAAQQAWTDTAILCDVLAPFREAITHILEIGCGNGIKLQQLCRYFNAVGEGIDPSTQAVTHGNAHCAAATHVHLAVGTAEVLPYEAHHFDLVYFGFCLYLVGRAELPYAVIEADRVLKPNGFLAILDFDPRVPHQRPYQHQAGVYTYKQDYADLFLAMGHYHLIHKKSFSHHNTHFDKNVDERLALWVLYKEAERSNTGA